MNTGRFWPSLRLIKFVRARELSHIPMTTRHGLQVMTRYANNVYVVYVESIDTHLGFQSESIMKSLEAPEMAVSF